MHPSEVRELLPRSRKRFADEGGIADAYYSRIVFREVSITFVMVFWINFDGRYAVPSGIIRQMRLRVDLPGKRLIAYADPVSLKFGDWSNANAADLVELQLRFQ